MTLMSNYYSYYDDEDEYFYVCSVEPNDQIARFVSQEEANQYIYHLSLNDY